jgi:hypothetical protein
LVNSTISVGRAVRACAIDPTATRLEAGATGKGFAQSRMGPIRERGARSNVMQGRPMRLHSHPAVIDHNRKRHSTLFPTPPSRLRNDKTTATHRCDLRRERRKHGASGMNAITVSCVSSGLEISPDILDSTENDCGVSQARALSPMDHGQYPPPSRLTRLPCRLLLRRTLSTDETHIYRVPNGKIAWPWAEAIMLERLTQLGVTKCVR